MYYVCVYHVHLKLWVLGDADYVQVLFFARKEFLIWTEELSPKVLPVNSKDPER